MKIDICFITSTPHLESHAALSNRHMALAHLVLGDEEYARFYRDTTKFVIMDNSAFEFEQEGRGVPQDEVYKAAKLIDADEVAAIDILFNGPDTVDSVKDFLRFMKRKDEIYFDTTQFMGIPQGRTEDEWLDCYEKLVTMNHISTIGLSKLSVPESFHGNHSDSANCTKGRIKCIEFLVEHNKTPDKFGKDTHLLGSDNAGVNEIAYYYSMGYDWIRSNDTSMPFVYGYNGERIKDGKVKNIVMEKLNFNKQLSHLELQAVDDNFITWRTINVN